MTKLADTSAWIWSRYPAYRQLRETFDTDLVEQLATSDMVRLELLYSARTASDFAHIRDALSTLMDRPIGDEQWQLRAVGLRASQRAGHQRAVKHPDLLVAAAAEGAVAVVHYDEDYDRIADITSPPTRWLAPAGTLH